jgi:hypothetical protein
LARARAVGQLKAALAVQNSIYRMFGGCAQMHSRDLSGVERFVAAMMAGDRE